MITISGIRNAYDAKGQKEVPFGFGNVLFMIAGTIGIALKNGYDFGFDGWVNQKYFVNPLPTIGNCRFKPFRMPSTYKGYDVGFCGFNVPDHSDIFGYLGSEKYFEHCKDTIRHYFKMKEVATPIKDCVLMHYRDYCNTDSFARLDQYYLDALKQFPNKPVVVITDNIDTAKKVLALDCQYLNNSPIIDFYLLSHADYLVMANSTFSWWAAWLSNAKIVAPKNWYAGDFKDCPTLDLYCKDWIVI